VIPLPKPHRGRPKRGEVRDPAWAKAYRDIREARYRIVNKDRRKQINAEYLERKRDGLLFNDRIYVFGASVYGDGREFPNFCLELASLMKYVRRP